MWLHCLIHMATPLMVEPLGPTSSTRVSNCKKSTRNTEIWRIQQIAGSTRNSVIGRRGECRSGEEYIYRQEFGTLRSETFCGECRSEQGIYTDRDSEVCIVYDLSDCEELVTSFSRLVSNIHWRFSWSRRFSRRWSDSRAAARNDSAVPPQCWFSWSTPILTEIIGVEFANSKRMSRPAPTASDDQNY
jgi:hypothetical protein